MATTFAEIRSLVRDLAQVQSTDEISDTTLNSYINNWYQYKLPSEITWNLNRVWTFATEAEQSSYAVTAAYRSLYDTIRVNGEELFFYHDRMAFSLDYPLQWDFEESFASGDASTVTFTGTIGNGYRLVQTTITIGDGTESFIDDGSGVLTGEFGGTGTVNYATGAISVTFNTAPALAQEISASGQYYLSGQPEAVLYNNNVLSFRPIPDATYTVQADYKAIPTALSADSDQPTRAVYGDLIAYGTAIDILERNGSFEEANYMKSAYSRILDVVNTESVLASSNKRPVPRW